MTAPNDRSGTHSTHPREEIMLKTLATIAGLSLAVGHWNGQCARRRRNPVAPVQGARYLEQSESVQKLRSSVLDQNFVGQTPMER